MTTYWKTGHLGAKNISKKVGNIATLELTNVLPISILTFASKKKEFGAITAVFDRPKGLETGTLFFEKDRSL